ncbi:MAG: hypothetical protein BWZ02_02388 [Lentisphaerae bacterium ADurb.BinA184]|nr:MAG: hypothetical protein BWZ02_02388 [Lentisphaerae bacterium ADurb.BinA184]
MATAPELTISGVAVYDVEPAVLPNLYHGAPIRVYGRYKAGGKAQIAVKADVRGIPFRQAAEIEFPDHDDDNPEIERMWALKRVSRLLKDADRAGNRAEVTPAIIGLGEAYSIVTEYTSFLVLENDAEYQRWKIARRNLDRTGRDRAAQQKRDEFLAALRQRAAADLGPQAVAADPSPAAAPTPGHGPGASPSNPGASSPAPATRPGNGVDFDFGTGPVGPLFVALAAWMSRRRKRSQE